MIDIIEKNIIQATLLDGVKKAGMHSSSVDQVTYSTDEIFSICLRYLGEFQNIREVFIGFLNLERITGEYIVEAILKFYRELGLDVKECRGQRYDGVANMQSKKKGVACFILRKGPDLIITNCCSHKLSLSLTASCNVAIIDNVLEVIKLLQFISTRLQKKRSYRSTMFLLIAKL